MKKLIGVVLLMVCLGIVVLGEWQFRSATTYTFTSSLVWTNLGTAAVRLSGFDCHFNAPATGVLSFSRIRGSNTNVWQSYSMTSATNVLATREEFDGLWLILNDILLIKNTATGTTCDVAVLNFEAQVF